MQPEAVLAFFAKYIEAELGIVYAEQNYFQLQNRLEEIAKLLAAPDLESLFRLAQKGITGQFKQLLLDIATNNETSFFRDPKIFRTLESIVLKAASENQFDGEKLRIWSAASSTGQEALSIAILINEYNKKTKPEIQFSIVGTDISERVLSKAKAAAYNQIEVQRGLTAPLLIKYFKKDEHDNWLASTDLTHKIEFQKLNLKDDFAFSNQFHLVLCRNVLIYQNVEGKKQILNRITNALAPRGFLVLGSGESLIGLSSDYEHFNVDGAILYRKREFSMAKTA